MNKILVTEISNVPKLYKKREREREKERERERAFDEKFYVHRLHDRKEKRLHMERIGEAAFANESRDCDAVPVNLLRMAKPRLHHSAPCNANSADAS